MHGAPVSKHLIHVFPCLLAKHKAQHQVSSRVQLFLSTRKAGFLGTAVVFYVLIRKSFHLVANDKAVAPWFGIL